MPWIGPRRSWESIWPRPSSSWLETRRRSLRSEIELSHTFRSVMSRVIIEAPIISPLGVLTGDTVNDTGMPVPSFFLRMVSKSRTDSPALIFPRKSAISPIQSGGARIDADRPLISCSVYPYILWAEAFQLSIMPSSVLLKIASYEFSTMVARRAWASSARFRAVISNTAIRNFAKAPASSVSGVLTSCA